MIGVLTQKKPFSSKNRWIALRQRVPHARRRPDHVGARPQMRHLAQELHRVRLRLDRIGVRVVDPADHLDRARLHLERLALAGDGTIVPVASTAQPVVSLSTSSA